MRPGRPPCRQWLHEIKHDGFRVIARKDGERVRLYSRPGNELTRRFPLIVEALARLRPRSASSTADFSLNAGRAPPIGATMQLHMP
jgi:ATP-dependent DNA ligase